MCNYAISVQGAFRLFLSLLFFPLAVKKKQSFTNENFILNLLKFSFERQLYVASINDAGNLVRSFTRNCVTCIFFF